ncbi:MAG: type II secretion system inner membrane protein GspF [Chromatiales bacterium]|nr:type II secretion system inner membrane protein GspF [Chromatiales bacterium]
MPNFRYKAATAGGETVDGEIDADSRARAVAQLQSQGYIPIRIDEVRAQSTSGRLLSLRLGEGGRRVSAKEITLITSELATLLRAGLPLDRALTILIEISDTPRVVELLQRIQKQVRGGTGLADALEAQSGVFSRLYVSMVRAGEAGGALETILDRLSKYLERARELRATVTNALIYPTILAVVAGLSVVFLLTFVVPKFEQLFQDAGKALPFATEIVIAAGRILREWWWALLLAIVLGWAALRTQLANPEFRRSWDAFWLRRWVIGDLIRKVETARFARTLATLLNNGVPLLSALEIVRETIGNRVLVVAIADITKGLREGQRIADPLLATGLFPPLAIQMLKVGEETGQMEGMLEQVAETYDVEVRNAVTRAVALLEPVIIIVLGLLVLGIIVSIMVAILSINDLAF